MIRWLLIGAIAPSLFAAEPPAGFDAALLKRVMKGEIVLEQKIDTAREMKSVFRAFVPGASPEAYQKVVLNYEKYPSIFSDVLQAQTRNTTPDSASYWIQLQVRVALFQREIELEGVHAIWYPKDAQSEGALLNTITNQEEYLEFATAYSRLIPWEGGTLIEDTVHLKLQPSVSFGSMLKKQVLQLFRKYIEGFRSVL
jgi:hypothetical protein